MTKKKMKSQLWHVCRFLRIVAFSLLHDMNITAAQVTSANKKLSRAGEVAWKQTKRLRQPSKLLSVFGGRRRSQAADGEWLSDEPDEEGGVDRRALLSIKCGPTWAAYFLA